MHLLNEEVFKAVVTCLVDLLITLRKTRVSLNV